MEELLDKIEHGDLEWTAMLGNFYLALTPGWRMLKQRAHLHPKLSKL